MENLKNFRLKNPEKLIVQGSDMHFIGISTPQCKSK